MKFFDILSLKMQISDMNYFFNCLLAHFPIARGHTKKSSVSWHIWSIFMRCYDLECNYQTWIIIFNYAPYPPPSSEGITIQKNLILLRHNWWNFARCFNSECKHQIWMIFQLRSVPHNCRGGGGKLYYTYFFVHILHINASIKTK